jgi:replicative DNA helicase
VEKLLPQNIEAESGVLGSIIIDPEAVVQVADFLAAEDFYRDAHRTIYEVILQLYERHEPADFITICDELERRNRLEEVGGASYITSLINQVPTSGNVEYYGRIVERTAILRRLIHAAGQIAAVAYEEGDADLALDKAEQLIFGISQRHARADFSILRDLLADYMEKLDQLHERRGTIVGVPTGFTDLDRLTGGLQRSDLIILAARPAVGKCLPAWTLIDHPETGERLTIEEYVHRRISVVHSLSDCGKIQVSQVTDWVDSGVKPCYRVQTRLGRMVEVTGHHPFLTIHGWIPLHDLKVGQYIAVPTRVDCFGSDESWPLEKVRLLASSVAKEKSFPVCVWTWSKRYLAEFLRALMSCDGSIYAMKAVQDRPIIEFSVASPQLAADVCHALLRFGIVAKYHRTTYNAWRVHITAAEDVKRYQEQIGWIGEKSQRFADSTYVGQLRGRNNGHAPVETWEYVRSASRGKGLSPTELTRKCGETAKVGKYAGYNAHTNRTIPGRRLAAYAEILEDVALQRIASPDIYWDEIVSIEPIGEHQVYDLTVPNGANFIAQDVFVHNTSLALSLAHNASIRHQQSVAIFSLEMSKEQLVQRLLSMDASIDQQRLRTGWIEDDEWERIITAMETLSQANLWIDDTAGISTMEMRSKARRLQAEQGIDLIIVDYLQLMQSSTGNKRNENRVQEISEISRNLKGLARELDVPVLALAQLSRAVESRQSKVPQLSDLRESGSIEQDADIVMFIYRDDVYNPDSERKNIADIIVAKHRNGPVGEISLYFQASQTRFRDLEVSPPAE